MLQLRCSSLSSLGMWLQVASLEMTALDALAVCMNSIANAEAALCTLPMPLLRAGFSAIAVDVQTSILTVANWPDDVESTVILAELVMAPMSDLQMTTTEGMSIRLNGRESL